jgi:MazG family protein
MYLLEEAYELFESIDSDNPEEVCGELGDLLFHIVFLARVFEEAGVFNIRDVVTTITEKMIRRHPHVFGQAEVTGPEDVKQRWHEIKLAEVKEKKAEQEGAFASVPQRLPALMRTYRISERAAKLGLQRLSTERLLERLDQVLLQFKATPRESNQEDTSIKTRRSSVHSRQPEPLSPRSSRRRPCEDPPEIHESL